MSSGPLGQADHHGQSSRCSHTATHRWQNRVYERRDLETKTHSEQRPFQKTGPYLSPPRRSQKAASDICTPKRRDSRHNDDPVSSSKALPTSTLRRRNSFTDLRTRSYYSTKPLPSLPEKPTPRSPSHHEGDRLDRCSDIDKPLPLLPDNPSSLLDGGTRAECPPAQRKPLLARVAERLRAGTARVIDKSRESINSVIPEGHLDATEIEHSPEKH